MDIKLLNEYKIIKYIRTVFESNPELILFCSISFCAWFKKFAQPSQPIRCKTKTNSDLITRVFPRVTPVTRICFAFSLVHYVVYVCCDWPL